MKIVIKACVFCFTWLLAFAVSSEPLRVGVVLPLTGGLAEYGTAAKNGIELAMEEHPHLFKETKFFYEDDRYESNMALSAYQKLVTIDKVDVMYLWGVGPADAVAPVAEKQKFPVFAVTCRRDIGKGKNYIIRFCYQGQEGGRILLEHLRSKGYKKIGLITAEMAFINTVVEGMRENLKEDESLDIVDNVLFTDNDFRGAITKLKYKQFDAVGVFLGSGQISQFYRQAASLKLKAKTFGTDFFDSLSEARDAQGAMSGAVFPAPATSRDFVARYQKRYGNDLQIPWAANAFDFAILLGKHLASAGEKLSAEEIIRRIKNIKAFNGASSSVVLKEDKKNGAGFDFPLVMKVIKEGRIIELSSDPSS